MLWKRKLRQGATQNYILESFTLYLRNYMCVILRAIENCVCSIRCIGRKMRPILQTDAQTREQMPPWILLPMHHFSTYNSNLCTLQYRKVTLYSLLNFVHCMGCLCILESTRNPPIFSLKISQKMFDNRLKSTQKVYSLGLTCMFV
jgi:hypothetical protein